MKLKQWVEKDEFENQVRRVVDPAIVLFAADWCGYCTRFLSIVSDYVIKDGILESPSDQVYVVNIDSNDESLWDTYKVDLVPTLVVFSKDKQVFRRDGKVFVGLKQSDLEDAIKITSAITAKKKDAS